MLSFLSRKAESNNKTENWVPNNIKHRNFIKSFTLRTVKSFLEVLQTENTWKSEIRYTYLIYLNGETLNALFT